PRRDRAPLEVGASARVTPRARLAAGLAAAVGALALPAAAWAHAALLLAVPLKRLGQGWYLVYWRAISVDGHPVRGAFTFAVGPNPGPAPEFVIPSISESAATPGLVTARWAAFLSIMLAVGLFSMRTLIARPA